MDIVTLAIIYLSLGAVAGLTAGLFGIGGGVVIVPALLLTFPFLGVDEAVMTHLAIGTSLATILITSVSSIQAHHKKGAVRWPVVWRITPGIIVGALFGAQIAGSLDGETLRKAFGIFLLIIAFKMGIGLKPKATRDLPTTPGLVFSGGVIGGISALFGIGGGSLTVPFLSWCRVAMAEAVASAAAVGFPIALAGAFGYFYTGLNAENLPDMATGYIYWPAFVGIVIASAPCAKVGAFIAHKLPARKLQIGFAILLGVIGLKFLL
ncbi:MAG: sulfite exporter TauE/SafE family protein [Cellvibrionaceae bacterium]